MPAGRACPSVYTFKASPYSSHSLILRQLPAHGEGRRVLDLGCSGGYLASILSGRGFRVTGVDVAGSDRGRFPPEGLFVEADLDSGLPPLSGEFDFVVCGDVLEHLKDPPRLLTQIRSALAPGAVLIASLPNSGHLYFRLTVLLGRFPADDRGLFDRTHLHFYTWTGWREMFSRAGFLISEVQGTGTPFGLAFPDWSESPPVRFLEQISAAFAGVWKTMFAYQFVVAAREAPAGEKRR